MDDATLCKEVAEKVMGWEERFLPNIGQVFKSERTPCEPPLSINGSNAWGNAGRVIEKMRERGWKFSLACENTGFWRAIFWPSEEEFLSIEDTVTGDTMPRAVFLAALEATEKA